jgi:hypothetical protein
LSLTSQTQSVLITRMPRVVGLVLVTVGLLLWIPSADAFEIPRVEIPRIDAPELSEDLPGILRHDVGVPEAIRPLLNNSTTYGSGRPETEEALKRATDDEAAAVSAHTYAGGTERNETKVHECVGEGLRKVSEDYKDASAQAISSGQAPEWPIFQDDFKAYVAGCLSGAFPQTADAAPTAVDALSDYLAKQAAPYAERALGADSAVAVVEKWLNVTANDVDGGADTNASVVPARAVGHGGDDSGSSFPWWILVAVVIVGAGVIGARALKPS